MWYFSNQLHVNGFPKDPSEFLNFKFTSKFALIHVNIVSLQIQILFC
jgi:hypothetical protein